MPHYCEKCRKMLNETSFYTSNNREKYPVDGKLNQCKKCITMHVDNWDPETYKWILEEIDVPYVAEIWNDELSKQTAAGKKLTGLTILGKYLSKMKLFQYREKRWADSDALAEEIRQKKRDAMKKQGYSDQEIEDIVSQESVVAQPAIEATPAEERSETDEFDDEVSEKLTEDEKVMLRLKWGHNYRANEWVRLEKLYQEMMQSYDIQGAGHKDTLIMICKASLKANQLIDAGELDGFQKMSKVYDNLMKSGKFKLWTMKNFSCYHRGL